MATKPRPLGDDSFLVVSSSKRSRAVVTRDVEFCPKCVGGARPGPCDFCNGTGKSDTFHRPQPKTTQKAIRARFRKAQVEDMVETFNRTQRPHMAKFKPKKWKNPDRIARTELTSYTRDYLRKIEEQGFKCKRLYQVLRADGTGTVYGEFHQPPKRARTAAAILSFDPETGYTRVTH